VAKLQKIFLNFIKKAQPLLKFFKK